jgi:hypothetical protein
LKSVLAEDFNSCLDDGFSFDDLVGHAMCRIAAAYRKHRQKELHRELLLN